ncbi:(2Fe-2S)-binding protein [Streptomyces sp. NBC_01217]|uniref:(2Fe-2S)-binding protein n=1 Tax=Streptomyces sp. NBC_01217 TaxID=2903779 RepID=UPI002E12526D|nr:(2Fe-2S)-binding protein [Streptomyces sp. NBC_01217]
MYVCSCFGITEKQVKDHAEAGACTPRQIASVCKAGTDCGSCVRAIQAVLGRGACPRRELLDGKRAPGTAAGITPDAVPEVAPVIAPEIAPGVAPAVRLSEAA